MIRRVRKKHSKDEVLKQMLPLVREWFDTRFEGLTEPQAYAVPIIHKRHNVLISSPTGSGKTLTAFLSIINELLNKQENDQLEDRIYCVYVSPLKALANDINKNLKQPLAELEELAEKKGIMKPKIRVAVRSGDTTNYERQKMAKKPPHILITTPESLAIILSTPKFSQALYTTEWLIMDEIHDICNSKRGVQLSVNLERLQSHLDGQATRIGLSATQAPIEEIAKYLSGYDDDDKLRPVRLVEVDSNKQIEVTVMTPVEDMTSMPFEIINARLYETLRDIVMENTTTLVFTNTRSGTENVLLKLSELGVENIAAHHGSLARETRLDVEDRLKRGELKAAVSSTSLELGIDIGSIDMVCQIGSPKSIAKGLQRIGRSGHGYGEVSRGKLIAFDNDDLMECAVLAKKASENYIDRVDLPKNSLDVLSQTIVGMSLEKVWRVDEAYDVIRKSYSFHELSKADFLSVVHYLASRDMPHVYSKIWLDDDTQEFGRKRSSRLIYYLNSGTIPEEANYKVYSDSGGRLGELSEGFVEKLSPGDVFVLGGKSYEFTKAMGMSIFVKPATGRRPTIPSWTGEMMPRSFDLSVAIGQFRGQMGQLAAQGKDIGEWLRKTYPLDRGGVKSILSYITEQVAFNGNVPSDTNLLMEGYLDPKGNLNIIFHYCFGRRTNDALARAYAMAISNKFHCNVSITVSDDCFMLTVPRRIKLEGLEKLVTQNNIVKLLEEAIRDTELFKQRFRHCSTRGFMILRNYQGREVPVGRQMQRSQKVLRALEDRDNFPIVRETMNEILNEAMNITGAKQILQGIEDGNIKVNHASVSDVPSPFAHNIVLVGMSDIVLMHDRSALLKELHRKVLMRVGGDKALEPEFDLEILSQHFADKWPNIARSEHIPKILTQVGPLEFFTRKSASIYDFSELPEDELAAMAGQLIESGHVASIWAGRSLWANPDELEDMAGIYSTGKKPDDAGKAILNALREKPKTSLALSKTLEADARKVRRDLGTLERAYLVERAGQDKKGNVTWGIREVKPKKPGKRFMGKMLTRHLEHFAPLTMDELAYDLALDKNLLSDLLAELESRGILSSGSFTEPDLQFLLTADRMELQGGGKEDIILQPQVENYQLAKHCRKINKIDDYFDRYGVVWMPQDLLARGKPALYTKWLKLRKNGDVLHGRFKDGSVCYVRKKDTQMYIDAYRRENLNDAEARLLNIIKANPGIDMISIGKKAEIPSVKAKELMEKLDRNMFIIRRFTDRESWSSTNHYQTLDMEPVPENKDKAVEKIIRITLKAYAPIALRSLAYATGFSIRHVKTVLEQDIASGKILEIQIAEGSNTKLLLPAEELAALKSMPTEESNEVQILTLYDPLVQPHRVELRRRFGDAWYFPIFQGARLIGMMEMWEMSGCIDIRQMILDEVSALPDVLRALDTFSIYYRKNLMDVIRIKNVIGSDVPDLEPDIIQIFENQGYIRVRDWLVKGNVVDTVVNESQFISYAVWKNHVMPNRRFHSIHEGLKVLGGFRSDEAASLRCKTTVPLKSLHKRDIVGYGQLIPKVLTYALPEEIALQKAALAVKPDKNMNIVLQMIKERGPVKWKEVIDNSPLGYQSSQDAKQRLSGSLHILRDAQNRYTQGPETSMDKDTARKEVIKSIFKQFGIFSAEHLAMYIKGQFRMFELRSILDQLELDDFLTKGYFLESSDSLHWIVKEDMGQFIKKPATFQVVITERDRLGFYLLPFVQKSFGIGTSWIVIKDGQLIAAARMRRRKDEFIMKELVGDSNAWHTMKAYSAELGKRMRREEDEVPDVEEDVVDWYERYVRPGGK